MNHQQNFVRKENYDLAISFLCKFLNFLFVLCLLKHFLQARWQMELSHPFILNPWHTLLFFCCLLGFLKQILWNWNGSPLGQTYETSFRAK